MVPGELSTACNAIADVPGPCEGDFCLTEGPGFGWTNDADSPAPGQLRVLGHVNHEDRIARFDGSRWSWETPPISELVVAFAGVVDGDIWAVGDAVFRFDGDAWREVEVPVALPQGGRFTDVVARAADDVWVQGRGLDVLLHWDGAAWTQQSIPIAGERLVLDEDGGLWLQGREEIARREGDDWQVFQLGSSGSRILELAGSLREGLFVVREKQPLLRWNGSGFVTFEIPDFEARHVAAWDGAIWISGHDPVANENALHRWVDGTLEKLEVPGGSVYLGDLVSAGTELWSLGARDISRWDGSCWQVHNVWLYVPSIAGPSEEYLWAFDAAGRVARWNGTSWRPVETGTQVALWDAWTAGPGEVWAVGEEGTVLRVKDGAFSQLGTEAVTGRLITIDGTGPDDVWVAGLEGAAWHWNGASWEARTIPGGWEIVDLDVAGDEVWAIGVEYIDYDLSSEFDSIAMRWNGANWEEMRSDLRERYDSVAIRGEDDVWIFGDGFALRWDGRSWSILNPQGTQLYAQAMWIDPDGAWIGDSHGLSSIGAQPTAPRFVPRGVRALCRDGADSTWMIDGLGRVNRLAGEVLEVLDAPADLRFVACAGPDDVWFAGWNVLAHWDGTQITQVGSFTWGSIGALWSHGPDDFWVAADSKLIRWDGASFSEVVVPGVDVYDVHGSAANDIWAVGAGGRASHWNGTSWTQTPTPTADALVQVWSFGSARAWALSDRGDLLSWDGGNWATGWQEDLRVWTIAGHGGELWISGWPRGGAPVDTPRFYVRGASGTWSPVEHAPWGYGRLNGLLLGADGTFSSASSTSFVQSGADPTTPWPAVELPVWSRQLLWRNAAGITWLSTGSGLLRWAPHEP